MVRIEIPTPFPAQSLPFLLVCQLIPYWLLAKATEDALNL